jgi:hypothetical protein
MLGGTNDEYNSGRPRVHCLRPSCIGFRVERPARSQLVGQRQDQNQSRACPGFFVSVGQKPVPIGCW